MAEWELERNLSDEAQRRPLMFGPALAHDVVRLTWHAVVETKLITNMYRSIIKASGNTFILCVFAEGTDSSIADLVDWRKEGSLLRALVELGEKTYYVVNDERQGPWPAQLTMTDIAGCPYLAKRTRLGMKIKDLYLCQDFERGVPVATIVEQEPNEQVYHVEQELDASVFEDLPFSVSRLRTELPWQHLLELLDGRQ